MPVPYNFEGKTSWIFITFGKDSSNYKETKRIE